ncbi:hypothetical protein [Streptomyces sp. H34-S4]|uniref:hypothetical protein n=1 Tax=Streptomyces sp. H34-S4 TaxID=2996463 RepID=UPI00226E317A|nr:hypothetical protein [Streptomyces sp. H34-S4]MCY0933618.1 hypothetical protein [Streptomyces sp. H34-S4]
MKLQVTACDIDQKFPATTYTVTASDGRSISKDLCKEHAAPFEEWLEEAFESDPEERARAVTVVREERSEPAPAPAAPAPKPAQRVTAKKAAPAKKAPARRRAKIVSLDEIEASKKA